MKLFVVAYAAYAVSWFLPVVDAGQVGLPFALKHPFGELAPLVQDFGTEPEDSPAKLHDTYGSWRGHEAARVVWDMFWSAIHEKPPSARRILDAAWCNLANPLFVLAAFLAFFGRIRLATLSITVGTFSAARWVLDGDLEVSAFRSGYWCWLSAFVVAAIGLWMASARTVLPAARDRA